ncbi:S-adenosyl-L-homocysteine hydrolase, partial [Tanacetum coccineum]
YWWCTGRALDWGPGGGLDLIVDDGGDATLLIHKGVKAEEEFAKTGKVPDPSSTDNVVFQIVLSIIKEGDIFKHAVGEAAENEGNDVPNGSRFSAVIEKIERFYMV